MYLYVQVAQAAECARAAELRAQVAKHNALEQAARRDARAQCHKLVGIVIITSPHTSVGSLYLCGVILTWMNFVCII